VAQVRRLAIGGEANLRWETGKITAFDVVSGALQLREYKPYQNILPLLDKKDDTGVVWFSYAGLDERVRYDSQCGLPLPLTGFVLEEDPRSWGGTPEQAYLDGSEKVGIDRNSLRYGGSLWISYQFDTGVPVRANRFVFYPKWLPDPVPEVCWHEGSPLWDTYMRAYQASASLHREPGIKYSGATMPDMPLDVILKEEPANHHRVVNIEFPLQPLRIFRLSNAIDMGYSLGEAEVYGEGFAPTAWYTSDVIDLKESVNFGRVSWDLKKFRWRKKWGWREPKDPSEYKELDLGRKSVEELWEADYIDPVPMEDPDVSVSISVEVRTGKDETPLIYYMVDELLNEKGVVVTQKEYLKLAARRWEFKRSAPIEPEMRGMIEYDSENWSQWTAVSSLGMEPGVPDAREYVQFRVKVSSEDVWAFGRLDSLWMEYSSPLAREVVGEVCLEEELKPEGGEVKVEAGRDTTFLYTLRADFVSEQQTGFDAVRIFTPSTPDFKVLRMGKPLEETEPDSVVEGDGYLKLILPSKVTGNDDLVQVAFRTAVLSYGTSFFSEVWDTEREDRLPQTVVPGDAVDEIGTNGLQVFATATSLKVLTGVTVRPEVITPNGDNINDYVTIIYTLALVSGGAEVEIRIYDMAGAKVRILERGEMGSTFARKIEWHGKDDDENLVLPGIYLCEIRVKTDVGEFVEVQPVTVVY
jgi:hypothetical protein